MFAEVEILPERIIAREDDYYTNANRYLFRDPGAKYIKRIFGASRLSILRDRLGLNCQYIPQFSKFDNCYEVENGEVVNIYHVIDLMQSEELKVLCESIARAKKAGDEDLRSKLKAKLPYICHAGIFLPRKNSGMIQPGFTYQLDIDKISNPDEVLQKIIADTELCILLASVSVSRNGIKALLLLKELMFLKDEWTAEQYRNAYHAATDILEQYFKRNYGVKIDTQMKAISQPMYLFYSEDLYIHKNLRR